MAKANAQRGGSGSDGGAAGTESVPPCILCGHSGRGPRAPFHLTHGVSVWLCQVHSSDEFVQRRSGKVFTERLVSIWVAAGAASAHKLAAARAHVRAVQHAMRDTSDLPGSYSWPKLREEAERRFAIGEDPTTVITNLRQTYRDGPAMVPTIRTMRRWFTDGRWRIAHPRGTRPPKARRRFVPPDLQRDPSYRYLRSLAFPWISPRDDP